MATNNFIDFDTHVYDQISIWYDYLDPKFRDRSPRWVTTDDGRLHMQLDDLVFPTSPGHPGYANSYGEHPKVDYTGNDPTTRLQYMDGKGDCDVHVIFPTLGLAGFPGSVRDADLAGAFARAYNRYMAEFTSVDRRRLRATILMPANHAEVAAAEMRWAHKNCDMNIAVLAPTPPGDKPWSHPSRDPIWRTAEELGITLVFHETTAGCLPNAVGNFRYQGNWPMIYMCTHVLEVQLAFADLILGGTLERFPNLKIGGAEAHVHWLTSWLAMLDQNFGAGTKIWSDQSGETALKLKPSEYFKRQCFIAAFPEDTMIADAMATAPESLVICSDWPHAIAEVHGGTGLGSVTKKAALTEKQGRQLLVENPTRFL